MFKCFVLNHPAARQPDGVVVRTSEQVLHVMSDESNMKALLLADTSAAMGMSSSKVTRSQIILIFIEKFYFTCIWNHLRVSFVDKLGIKKNVEMVEKLLHH